MCGSITALVMGSSPTQRNSFLRSWKDAPRPRRLSFPWAIITSTAKALAKALDEYAHALQMNPKSAEAHNRMAEVYAAQNKPGEAREHLRQALQLWSQLQDQRVPETFWSGVSETIERAGPPCVPISIDSCEPTSVATALIASSLS